MTHVCDFCGHGYKYKRNLKRHINEKHLQTEHWQCEIENCNKTFQRRSFLCEHLCNVHKLSRECARKICITTERVISKGQSEYLSDVSEDDTVLDLLEEEEQASANFQHGVEVPVDMGRSTVPVEPEASTSTAYMDTVYPTFSDISEDSEEDDVIFMGSSNPQAISNDFYSGVTCTSENFIIAMNRTSYFQGGVLLCQQDTLYQTEWIN